MDYSYEPLHNDPVILMLRKTRREQNLSQFKLAKKIGCDPSVITRWEHGYTSPTLDRLHEWANALGMKVYLSNE